MGSFEKVMRALASRLLFIYDDVNDQDKKIGVFGSLTTDTIKCNNFQSNQVRENEKIQILC